MSNPIDGRLYDHYRANDRLRALTEPFPQNVTPEEWDEIEKARPAVTQEDVKELFRTYSEGAISYAGVKPNLLDFAAWILGNRITDIRYGYEDAEPAEIVW